MLSFLSWVLNDLVDIHELEAVFIHLQLFFREALAIAPEQKYCNDHVDNQRLSKKKRAKVLQHVTLLHIKLHNAPEHKYCNTLHCYTH